MKIKYNEEEKVIEIEDGLKTQYFFFYFLMIINLISSVVNLISYKNREFDGLGYYWIILGVISLVLLVYFFFKKSTLEKIPVATIKRLREKVFLAEKDSVWN